MPDQPHHEEWPSYISERSKHECTKRALNKAIRLANLLLDEISNTKGLDENLKTASKSMRYVDEGTPEYQINYSPCVRQILKHDTPDSFIEVTRRTHKQFKTDLNADDACDDTRVNKNKSASKELSELTSLIRKGNHIIKNVKTADGSQ